MAPCHGTGSASRHRRCRAGASGAAHDNRTDLDGSRRPRGWETVDRRPLRARRSAQIPTPETSEFPAQTSLYGASKAAAEGYLAAFAEAG